METFEELKARRVKERKELLDAGLKALSQPSGNSAYSVAARLDVVQNVVRDLYPELTAVDELEFELNKLADSRLLEIFYRALKELEEEER